MMVKRPVVIIYSESLSSYLLYKEFIEQYPHLVACIIRLPYIPRKKEKTSFLKEPILKKLLFGPSKKFLLFSFCVVTLFEFISRIFRNRIADLARRKCVNFYEFNHINADFIALIKRYDPDWIFNNSTSILKDDILGIPKHGTINYHGGKLPGYRNVACMIWMLYNKEKNVNGTLHYVVEKVDAGDVIMTGAEYSVKERDSIFNVWYQIAVSGSKCILDLVPSIVKSEGVSVFPQNEESAAIYGFPTPLVMNEIRKQGITMFKLADILRFFNISAGRHYENAQFCRDDR